MKQVAKSGNGLTFIIFNTEFIILNEKFIVFKQPFIILNTFKTPDIRRALVVFERPVAVAPVPFKIIKSIVL